MIYGENIKYSIAKVIYTALTLKLFSFQSFFPFEFQFIKILVIVPDQIPIEISICSRRFLRLKINRRYIFLNITSSTVSRFLCFFVSSPAKTAPHPFPLTRTLHLPWQFQRDASNLRWTSRNFDEVSSIQARCSNQFRSIVYLTQFAARRAFATRLIIPPRMINVERIDASRTMKPSIFSLLSINIYKRLLYTCIHIYIYTYQASNSAEYTRVPMVHCERSNFVMGHANDLGYRVE